MTVKVPILAVLKKNTIKASMMQPGIDRRKYIEKGIETDYKVLNIFDSSQELKVNL